MMEKRTRQKVLRKIRTTKARAQRIFGKRITTVTVNLSLSQLIYAYLFHFLLAEAGKMHAKLHKQISITLSKEDTELREAMDSLAIVRKYALELNDRQQEIEIWHSLQSRQVMLPLLQYIQLITA